VNVSTVTLEEVQAHLAELIDELGPGEELVIVRNAVPVAKMVSLTYDRPRPVPGRGRGKVVVVSDDDEHLRDFAEYMP
jgi:antitoxin (DNA-binding transcriptional repressor) of toxin-antitoxin stability system